MTIFEIALPTPLYRTFDYLAPAHIPAATLAIGARVQVSFGRQQLIGIIVKSKSHSDIPLHKLKMISAVLDDSSIFPAALFKLLQWASDYYHYPLGEVLAHALPALLRQGKVAQLAQEKIWQLSSIGKMLDPASLRRSPRQLALLQLFQQHPVGISATQLKQWDVNSAILKKFRLAEWIISVESPARQNLINPIHSNLTKSKLTLNTAQQLAVNRITDSLQHFQVFLLMGITGSGKTEVYFHALEKILAEGKQGLMLVPEIALTPQTLQRFQARFSVPIAVYHSGLSDSERLQTWLQAKQGDAKLVIATRSGIFLPFKELGLIILDEEHDLSFKQQEGFHYSARDVAIRRAQLENFPIVLGSATPSLETFYNAERERYHLLELPERAGLAVLPQFKIVDMRQQTLVAGIAPVLMDAIKKALEHHHQVLLFLNRRGYSPVYLCHSCGWIANCSRCDAYMTLHNKPYHLHCHHCDKTQAVMQQCPACRGYELLTVGVGTEQLEKSLQEIFPDIPIVRVDRDTTRRKGSLDKHLQQIQQGHRQILIGTQMLAKGHHFPNVTLVGILNADNGLFSADFRGLERTAQLILQVAGRSGRGENPGTVFIQTHYPQQPLLHDLIEKGYATFSRDLLVERNSASLPPFTHMALLRAESVNSQAAQHFLKTVREAAEKYQISDITFLGPVTAPMEKRSDRYRWQLLLRTSQRQALQHLLSHLCEIVPKLNAHHKVRWSLDVDPQEMF